MDGSRIAQTRLRYDWFKDRAILCLGFDLENKPYNWSIVLGIYQISRVNFPIGVSVLIFA